MEVDLADAFRASVGRRKGRLHRQRWQEQRQRWQGRDFRQADESFARVVEVSVSGDAGARNLGNKCKNINDQRKSDTAQNPCRTCGMLGHMSKDCNKKGALGDAAAVSFADDDTYHRLLVLGLFPRPREGKGMLVANIDSWVARSVIPDGLLHEYPIRHKTRCHGDNSDPLCAKPLSNGAVGVSSASWTVARCRKMRVARAQQPLLRLCGMCKAGNRIAFGLNDQGAAMP